MANGRVHVLPRAVARWPSAWNGSTAETLDVDWLKLRFLFLNDFKHAVSDIYLWCSGWGYLPENASYRLVGVCTCIKKCISCWYRWRSRGRGQCVGVKRRGGVRLLQNSRASWIQVLLINKQAFTIRNACLNPFALLSHSPSWLHSWLSTLSPYQLLIASVYFPFCQGAVGRVAGWCALKHWSSLYLTLPPSVKLSSCSPGDLVRATPAAAVLNPV